MAEEYPPPQAASITRSSPRGTNTPESGPGFFFRWFRTDGIYGRDFLKSESTICLPGILSDDGSMGLIYYIYLPT